jgi:hypothetical protein
MWTIVVPEATATVLAARHYQRAQAFATTHRTPHVLAGYHPTTVSVREVEGHGIVGGPDTVETLVRRSTATVGHRKV